MLAQEKTLQVRHAANVTPWRACWRYIAGVLPAPPGVDQRAPCRHRRRDRRPILPPLGLVANVAERLTIRRVPRVAPGRDRHDVVNLKAARLSTVPTPVAVPLPDLSPDDLPSWRA